ncbi:MAG: DsrE family protein [Deltaproteobacteria bacterium]|nr:DsrE family protein [Deltaproteobacteria bacterium]
MKKIHLIVVGIGLVSLITSVLVNLRLSFSADPTTLIAPCTASAATAPQKHIVVRLGHYTDDLHAAGMAVGFAKTMQERGQKVTLMLTLEGVRLADARTPQDLKWGHGDEIGKVYEGFRKAGGEIIVCPHCAEAAGIDEKSLRPGAVFGKEGHDLVDVLIAADKVVDF